MKLNFAGSREMVVVCFAAVVYSICPGLKAQEAKLFREVMAEHSGVEFVNRLVENEHVNFYAYQSLFNGGGVAIVDINNDGLQDLYFTGNMCPDSLYLNRGDLVFEDVSERSGIRGFEGWKTGVSVVDVNEDGWMDIYVCRSGWYDDPEIRRNLLFVNQGDGTFREEATLYGLGDTGNSIQCVFFDYDRDGDLDAYLTNHPTHYRQTLTERLERAKDPKAKERDKLYRNDGKDGFVDVSRESGIYNYGHGLGLIVSDLNDDGWPDVYVANDYQTQDFYYENNRDGTFSSRLEEVIKHCSYFSMGTDIADINNDGLLDIMTVEMLAEGNRRQKTNMAPMNPSLFKAFVDAGFHWQMMRNTLQLNNGNDSFSEIGYFAGVAATDWSWGPLLADYDNDGDKDLLITNGFVKDTQDKDFAIASSELAEQTNGQLTFQQVNEMLPQTRIRNYAYEYTGDYRFSDVSTEWGFDFEGFSNGIAYGDLDNDGDLDVVVSNINDTASVYENRADQLIKGNWFGVRFEGASGNPSGIGNKVRLLTKAGIQFQEMQVVRGFQSTVSDVMHFGLGEIDSIDKIEVTWWDGRTEALTPEGVNRVLTISYGNSSEEPFPAKEKRAGGWSEVTEEVGVDFTHIENLYDDYEKELLLPHKQSHNGPCIAVGDVNEDGLDDFYIGGAAEQAGELYVQKEDGTFRPALTLALAMDSSCEDIAAEFFDADGDGDLDLYVVSGGNEFEVGAEELRDRLYFNDGKANFTRTDDALPDLRASGGAIAVGDYDGDGDLDLFVGGRIVPGQYPRAPRSYLLRNEGGTFSDVTIEVAPDLESPGLVTSAKWSDYDGDGQLDLVVAGEWMPIQFYRNQSGELSRVEGSSIPVDTEGWWNEILAADFDGDGDEDYLFGNLGLNYKYQASVERPFHVYLNDFDSDGKEDIVLGYYNSRDGDYFPVRGYQCSKEQMPGITRKIKSYTEFGTTSLTGIYGGALSEGLNLEAKRFDHVYLDNRGGYFEIHSLPDEVQFAPVQGMDALDITGDGNPEVIGAGNLYVSEVETGRADAGVGFVLKRSAEGAWENELSRDSGFFASLDAREVKVLNRNHPEGPLVLVANNDGKLQVFRYTDPDE